MFETERIFNLPTPFSSVFLKQLLIICLFSFSKRSARLAVEISRPFPGGAGSVRSTREFSFNDLFEWPCEWFVVMLEKAGLKIMYLNATIASDFHGAADE